MTPKTIKPRLSNIEREILQALRDGEMITIDRFNMAYLGSRPIQSQTRYFLTQNRLITRFDKSKAVEAKGNGFTISKKGLLLLEKAAPPKREAGLAPRSQAKSLRQNSPPTEKQLSYARNLGLEVPEEATKAEVSDLLSMHLERDKIASERHRSFADLYGVDYTRFTGKRELFERILYVLKAPGRDQELAAWFVYRVYRGLAHDVEDTLVKSPGDTIIKEIAEQLASDEGVMQSIRRYEGRDLIWFGEWTAPNGAVHTGGSNRTTAYKKASAILRDRLSLTGQRSTGKREARGSFPVGQASKTEAKEPLRRPKIQQQDKGGCLSVLLFAGIVMTGIIVTLINV